MSPAYAAGAVQGYANGFTLPGYAPSTGSRYFTPVELVSGTIGSPVKMPYVPNSMVLDKTGTNLYFGSSHELMIYAAGTNSITKEDPNVPGVVLSAAPDNSRIVINDPLRQLFYMYTPSSVQPSRPTAASALLAQWTPDAKTVYIVGTSYHGSASGSTTTTLTPTLVCLQREYRVGQVHLPIPGFVANRGNNRAGRGRFPRVEPRRLLMAGARTLDHDAPGTSIRLIRRWRRCFERLRPTFSARQPMART